ncbi:restriction endonuclease subunit S [Tetragenococcus halophilus]|uniref:restriction endonuclease subunit S n=1 Tax=Tetragenococcus halophilus TaxID=51669 RepID=UPI002565007B|nr:restriction endonuclease subunit S [Tetragenococcus halophilus]GMG68156.1 hypothetical protein TEHMS4_10910 [Tetragenococcus halophilus]
MDYKSLSDICSYVNERIATNDINLNQYISTENMIPNKGGVTKSKKLPNGKTTKAYKKGDILISNIRPYFRKIWHATQEGGCSGDILVVRAKQGVNSRFLYYLLSSDSFFEFDNATSKGTKMPRGDKKAIMQYRIPDLPPENEQKVASILGSLDKRIILNEKINHHLEEIGKTLFDEMYPLGNIAQLGNIIKTLESGTRPKDREETDDIPSIGAENIERFGQYDYTKEKFISSDYFKNLKRGIVHSGDVLLYKDGAYTGKVSMTLDNFPHDKAAINEHVFILRPNKLAPSSFFLYYLLLDDENRQALFSRASSKAAQPGLNQTEVKTLPILLPTTEVIIKFDEKVTPLMHQIAKNANENRKLASLRDTLLSKLMSEEILVTQATK